MRKILVLIVFLALSGVAAKAQEPRVELFTGLSYGQFNPGDFLTDGGNPNGRHFSVPGVEITPQFNFSKWFGIVGDISAYGGTGDIDDAFPEHLRFYNYLVGPQLTARHVGPINVFVRGLVGVSHARVSATQFDQNNNTSTLSASQNRLAYGFGGGIDLNATKHIALRLVQVDFIRNSFTNCPADTQTVGPCAALDSGGNVITVTKSGRQNNIRVAIGFNWRF